MLQRMRTCWRLLDRWSRPADLPPIAGSERRVWVRYRSHLHATFQPETEDATPVPARVANVSRGGINLVVDRPFRRGMLVSVDLPGPTADRAAAVQHVTPLGPSAWALGCYFAAELNDAELQAFGAKRLPAPACDRRTWVRFPCAGQVSYHCLSDPHQTRRPARLRNISRTGVALLTDRLLDADSLLAIHVPGSRRRRPYTVLARVVYQRTESTAQWIAGCSFIRQLSDHELALDSQARIED